MAASRADTYMADRVRGFGVTIFAEMTALALKHAAVNLGQGYPDFPAPEFVKRAACEAVMRDENQYTRSAGHPKLVEAIAKLWQRDWGYSPDPITEITVTVGATEGLFASIQALINPGDEVLIIEPFYDAYPADVIMAGGVPRYVPLRPDVNGEWVLDLDEVRRAITPRTRMLILNTPHNPTGKVFTREELEGLAAIAQEYDLIVLSDEVYDYLTFDGYTHVRIATLPGMWERTLTLGSAGKMFGVTGWKVGWVVGSAALNEAVRKAHQWIPFCVATPLQVAVAHALAEAPSQGYFEQMRVAYEHKRNLLVAALREVGLEPYATHGTYFVLARIDTLGWDDDVAFCRWLTTEVGVTAIPPTAFYSEAHKDMGRRMARFAFCKRDEALHEAARRLRERLPQRPRTGHERPAAPGGQEGR